MLIVGCSARDGSADLALSVGTVLARAGRRVVVVDANEEAGELSHLAGIDGMPGLAELLDDPAQDVAELVVSRPRGPAILSRGHAARVELVDADAAEACVETLRKSYEVVVITAAPIHLSGNALVWARAVKSVVVAAERDRARRDDVAYAIDNLVAVHASILGTVLLDRAPRQRRAGRTSQPRGQHRTDRQDRVRRGPTATKRDIVAESARVRRSDELGR